MPIHRTRPDRRPDDAFLPGELDLLVPGNRGRLLDDRRTPGLIEAVDPETAMFRWRITEFEDAGRCWELPVEQVRQLRFEPDSRRLDSAGADALARRAERFQEPLEIPAREEDREASERDIRAAEAEARDWLRSEARFFQRPDHEPFPEIRPASTALAGNLERYFTERGFEDLERRTAEGLVLNPHSGEWIKGLAIVLAEMGLVPYRGRVVRTPDLFEGSGSKERRREYLVHRLGIVRACWSLLGRSEVVLYRGLRTEKDWLSRRSRTFVSCTFDLRVARRGFTDFDRGSRFRHSLLMKATVPVTRLFMTCLETGAMNRRYSEAEALVLAGPEDPFLPPPPRLL